MAVRATHVPTGTDITIGPYMDDVSAAVMADVHGRCGVKDGVGILECREHDNDPALAHLRGEDGRVHTAWMYVQKRTDKWLLCHSPSGIGREFRNHEIHLMTDQHRWQQDYWCNAGQHAGYTTDQEVVLPTGTRLDVTITGPAGTVAVEVQHSGLTVPKVRSRTLKARDAGIRSIWSADRKNPPWAFKVAHVETNELPHGHAPRGSWTITTGPRHVRSVRCTPRNADLLAACHKPPRHRGYCGRSHPMFEPIGGLRVDDVAEMAPAGALVELVTNTKQGTILVTPEHFELWRVEFAPQFPPRARNPRNDAKRCVYHPTLQAPEPAPVIWRRPAPAPTRCDGCGTETVVIADGLCLSCRLGPLPSAGA